MDQKHIIVGERYSFSWEDKVYFGKINGTYRDMYWVRTYKNEEPIDVLVGPRDINEPTYNFVVGKRYDIQIITDNGQFQHYQNIEATESPIKRDIFPIGFIIDGVALACSMDCIICIAPKLEDDVCVCDRHIVFNLGCKCGAFKREMERKRKC